MLIGIETNPTNQLDQVVHDPFNAGFIAGIAGDVPEIELTDVVQKLAAVPVEEWLTTDPQLRFGCGLLAAWLGWESGRELRALLQQSQE